MVLAAKRHDARVPDVAYPAADRQLQRACAGREPLTGNVPGAGAVWVGGVDLPLRLLVPRAPRGAARLAIHRRGGVGDDVGPPMAEGQAPGLLG